MDLRSVVLGIDSPACEMPTSKEEFTCFSKTGSKYYANGNKTDETYREFCKEVGKDYPKDMSDWRYTKTFHQDTPDKHEYVVQLQNGVSSFNQKECEDSLSWIIHACDNSESDNPMKWKGGGRYVRHDGDYKYELHPRRDNRIWPPPRAPYGMCVSKYNVFWSSYAIVGTGFSTWDHGQKTMRPNMDSCYGSGTTAWKFEYYDFPSDHNGYEWVATFNTPIWTSARCFQNNKVVKGALGWTDGCMGDD